LISCIVGDVAITRRSFLAGLGSVSVGLLFRRQLDAVLQSLERELVDEPQAPGQVPSAVDVVVRPQAEFRPRRLVVPGALASLFVLEEISVGSRSRQESWPVQASAGLFSAGCLDAPQLELGEAGPGTEIRFRVCYVGSDPAGARFLASLLGRSRDSSQMMILPVDSGCAIVA
jgi:hypothetical protein